MKKIKIIILLFLILLVSACGEKEVIDLSKGTIDTITYQETEEITNYVKIEMDFDEAILLELYPDKAPITVENFQNLVKEKFFDGSIFHRVVKDFMIQGGISAKGEVADSIKGEFKNNNGFNNPVSHERGVISMARTSDNMNSASSQFFIMHQDNLGLDGDYAAFGRVIAGLSTVDKIANTAVDNPYSMAPKPIKDQVIRSIRFISLIEE